MNALRIRGWLLTGAAGLALCLSGCHQIHEAKARQLTRSSVEAFFEKDFDKAMEHSEIALRLGSKEPVLHRLRATILLERGDAATALEEVDAGLAYFAVVPGAETTAKPDEERPPEEQAEYHALRSRALQALGRIEDALAALEEAVLLGPENPGAQNNLAWLLATSPRDSLRNGNRAIEHARKACEITEWKEAGAIDTLAAAYAEAGDFALAEKWQREAIAKASPAQVSDESAGFEARLKLFQEKTPYREDPAAEFEAGRKAAETAPAKAP